MIVSKGEDGCRGYMMQPQNFSVNDGEGIRTVLFFSGCPLRCRWCSNPECFDSVDKNPFVHAYTTEEIRRHVEGQRIFYRFSGGGVTFSGGEATTQHDFLDRLSSMFYDDGLDLALETSGHFDFDKVQHILERMNLIFVDIKHMNPHEHAALTGVSNELILNNIKKMAALTARLVVRIPVISGANATEDNIRATARFVKEHVIRPEIELLPYHRFGEYKYGKLGRPTPDASYTTPSKALLERFRGIVEDEGVKVVSYK